MKIKYEVVNFNKFLPTKIKKKTFFFKKYEKKNYFVLKRSKFCKNTYINLNKDTSLIKDDYININNNLFSKEKNFFEVSKFKIPGFKKKFLEFFENRSELLKEYSFENYDELS